MYPTAGNVLVRSAVMNRPLITMVQRFDPRPGSRPGEARLHEVALTFQYFAIALASSMSNPTGFPAEVFDSMGGTSDRCRT